MKFSHAVKTAIAGLASHKSRSVLTILGIVIGVAAVILVVSLGKGAQNLILGQIQGLGSKTIAVLPGREPKGPSDIAQTFSDSLKEKDLEALRRKDNVPTLEKIMPVVFGGASASYGDETYRLTILGVSGLVGEIFDLRPQTGVFLTEDDVKNRAAAVVIGAKVKDELFGESAALGERIKIKGRNFRVVGVLPKKGQVSFFNFDEMALVPYTTAQQYIFGIKYFHRFIIQPSSEEEIGRTVQDVKITLRNSHGISSPDKDDFFVETQADLAARLGTITSVLTLFLAAIAAISLLVGGVGIMNIMLVSVTERTREIGLRKAVGATNRDILNQFLLEAIILTLIGGILSFLSSLALSNFAGLNWSFTFPLSAAFAGLLVSSLVGLVFGLYPAHQASLKSPIEALRYE